MEQKIKKVYAYNRLTRTIIECEIIEIDESDFAKFKYIYGSYDTWHYNLKGSYVQYLNRKSGVPKSHILVCPDILSLSLIQESDNHILNNIKENLIKYINLI